jgi:hypothetical protein
MKRILIVEDDEVRLERFRAELEGFEFDVVHSAADAIERISTRDYDLIFLDHDLEFGQRVYVDPYEANTGYQVARCLEERKASMPIVVHSFNWFGANKIVKLLPTAVYVPFGLYPIRQIAELFLERGLDPRMKNLGDFLV